MKNVIGLVVVTWMLMPVVAQALDKNAVKAKGNALVGQVTQINDKVSKKTDEASEKVKKVKNTEKTMKVDPALSAVNWKATKVTGEHMGKVSVKEGEFNIKADMSVLNGTITMDMNSIICEDLKDKDYNKKLVGHLKSDEFFDVSKFPTATLKINKMVLGHTFAEGSPNADVEGKITIKGVTQSVKFKANYLPNPKNGTFEVSGNFDLDRTDFGIKYGSGKFFQNLGDKMIHDKFNVTFKVIAKK